jgi:hypothetical protein
MLDTAIGPVTRVVDVHSIQVHVTHIGRHNQFRYNTYETVYVASNNTGRTLAGLVGLRVRCNVKYRDVYNRLVADVELETVSRSLFK